MELKDVLSFVGIEADTIDKFKEQFQSKYATEEQIHADPQRLSKITGKTVGNIQRAIYNVGRAHGVKFDLPEFEGKPIEDVVNTMFTRIFDEHTGKVKELEVAAKAGNDDRVKDLQSKYEKLESELRDTKGQLKATSDSYDVYKQQSADTIKGVKIGVIRNESLSSIPFKPGITEIERKGFESHIEKTYKLDFDDKDQPIITTADGKRIPNPEKASEWLAPAAVFKSEAEKYQLTAKNTQSGKPVFTQTQQPSFTGGQFTSGQSQNQSQVEPTAPSGRKVHPRARVD